MLFDADRSLDACPTRHTITPHAPYSRYYTLYLQYLSTQSCAGTVPGDAIGCRIGRPVIGCRIGRPDDTTYYEYGYGIS